MKSVAFFAACLGFAMPCYADQIGEPVTVPVTATVSSVVLCDFDTRLCTDESVNAEGGGMNYYNEFEPKASAALRQLIADGLIPQGEVDTRSITDVRPDDLRGFTQCHFFAGIGGWSRALELAGWPTDRPVWTGSCPCQPFSSAGKQKGKEDERHLWPVWFNLIRECRPAKVYGEQVASAVSHGWLDGVYSDMEAEGYAIGSAVLPACAVDAPHKRDRLWFVANSCDQRFQRYEGIGWETQRGIEHTSSMGNSEHDGSLGSKELRSHETTGTKWRSEGKDISWQPSGTSQFRNVQGIQRSDIGERGSTASNGAMANTECIGRPRQRQMGEPLYSTACANVETDQPFNAGTGFWSEHDWIICGDGKARRIPTTESGIRLLAYGFPERVGLLRAGGNAIVPEVAARFIQATM